MDDTGGTLPRSVRCGYGTGSVATGAFGTVPGLMLLPYLTDTPRHRRRSGPALIVFAPKAWDVVLNPIAGRISDRTVDARRARGARGCCAAACCSRCASRCCSPAPTSARGRWTAAGCWSLPRAARRRTPSSRCRTSRCPPRSPTSYDERTRLMTWRVAILAFTIMLAGATAPLIRDAVGGRDGYRVMGVVMAVDHRARRRRRRTSAPAARRSARSRAGAGSLRDQLRIVSHRARLPAAADDLRAPGAGDRLHAGRRRLPRRGRARSTGAATILFVCFVGPALLAHAAVGAVRHARRQEARLHRGLAGPRRPVPRRRSLAPVRARRRWSSPRPALIGVGYAGCQVFPMAMLPDAAAADAARTGENRAGVFTGVWTAGETLGLALGPGGVRARAGARRLRLVARAATSSSPTRPCTAIALGFSLLPAALTLLSLLVAARLHPRCGRRRPRDHGGHDMNARPRPDACPAGRRPARPRRPHAGLRVRLRAAPRSTRIGREARGGVRRLQRPRPDRLPQPAPDGERAGRRRRAACSTRRTRRSAR